MDEEIFVNSNNKENIDEEVEVMAVSVKPAPIVKGEAAKKIIEAMGKPSNNSELFKKCKELSNLFERK